MLPYYEQVVQEYGEEMANDPAVLARIYERAGGDEAFAGELEDEGYRQAILGADGSGDPLTGGPWPGRGQRDR